MKEQRFHIAVIFTVEAEPVGPWNARESALSILSHLIDQGYQSEQIKDWQIVDVQLSSPKAKKNEQPLQRPTRRTVG